jgi:hypothetical protein
VPSAVWADIGIDFIEGLPKVNGSLVILTVVDGFSKSVHFLPLGHLYTTTTIERIFFDNIVKLHGMPNWSLLAGTLQAHWCQFIVLVGLSPAV